MCSESIRAMQVFFAYLLFNVLPFLLFLKRGELKNVQADSKLSITEEMCGINAQTRFSTGASSYGAFAY